MKTVYVTAGETTLIEWKNIPITAQIQIVKKSLSVLWMRMPLKGLFSTVRVVFLPFFMVK